MIEILKILKSIFDSNITKSILYSPIFLSIIVVCIIIFGFYFTAPKKVKKNLEIDYLFRWWFYSSLIITGVLFVNEKIHMEMEKQNSINSDINQIIKGGGGGIKVIPKSSFDVTGSEVSMFM